MNHQKESDETPWRAVFRINHSSGYLADTLQRSTILAGMQASAVDRDIHLTDLVFRVCSDDSSKVLGRAAVVLWYTLEEESVRSPVVEAAVISDGEDIVIDCTKAYDKLRNERLDLANAEYADL